MARILIEVVFKLFRYIVLGVFGPIFDVLDSLFATLNLNQYVSLFNNILTQYVGPMVGFFFEFMGPHTISVIGLEIAVTIGFYGIMIATTFFLKVLKFIKKLPLA